MSTALRGPSLRRFWPAVVTVGLVASAVAGVGAVRGAGSASCEATEVEHTSAVYRALDGVDPELTSLDVHASASARNCPILVWVHGGSWQAGSRRTRSTTVKAEHFVAQGWVFVSVDYRLASETNDVRWPAFGDDVASAVDWVIDNADEIGGDASSVSIIGHSAGAHLVSIIGTNPNLLAQHGRTVDDVSCVVSLDSVTHVLTDPPPWEVDIVDLAFPTEASKTDGSPTLQAAAHDPSAGPAFLIVTRGRDERIESSELLASTLRAGGGDASVADVSPYDHGEVSTMLGVAGETVVTPVVDEFLNSCRFAGEPAS